MVTPLEQMEADLCGRIGSGAISHAENILATLREYEARGMTHAAAVHALHLEVGP